MVAVLPSRLSDLSDDELDALACSIAREQAHREALAARSQAAAAEAAAAAPKPTPKEEPAAVYVYITNHGRCWHRRKTCQHLRNSRTITELLEIPKDKRPCKTCAS